MQAFLQKRIDEDEAVKQEIKTLIDELDGYESNIMNIYKFFTLLIFLLHYFFKGRIILLCFSLSCPLSAFIRRRTVSCRTSWSRSCSSRARWRWHPQTSFLTTLTLYSTTGVWWRTSTEPSGSAYTTKHWENNHTYIYNLTQCRALIIENTAVQLQQRNTFLVI